MAVNELQESFTITAENLANLTPHQKRSNVELDHSPQLVGTFSLSDLKTQLQLVFDEKLPEHLKDVKDQLKTFTEKLPVFLELENKVQSLQSENTELKQKLEKLELHSRQNNVKFHGIFEAANEKCEEVLLSKLRDICPEFGTRTFNRVHRFGPKVKGQTRGIIASFAHYKDKIYLKSNIPALIAKNIYTSDDLPHAMEARKRELLPIFKAARNLHKLSGGLERNRPKLYNDQLVIDGKTYTVDNLDDLPLALSPEAISTPRRNGITAFYSYKSKFSNHYKRSFKVNDRVFDYMEEYFMTEKALTFDDYAKADEIKLAKTPGNMKKLGYEITGMMKKNGCLFVRIRFSED